MKKGYLLRIIFVAFLFLCLFALSKATEAKADAATPITIGDIDYEALTMKVYKNGNAKVYYSATMASDLSAWNELSDTHSDDNDGKGGYILMDISWTSSGSETSFYLRGDVDMTAVNIKLPKSSTSFKVVFDKVNGVFEFDGQDDVEYFFYRKNTDYNWIKVYFEGAGNPPAGDPSVISYSTFLKNVEMLRFKGAKLVFRLGQKIGQNLNDMGNRPSKEVTISIAKYASAPSLKLNITKLTINTKATMEWTDDINGTWSECDKNMELEDLTTEVFLKPGQTSGSVEKTLYFRLAATEKKPCSQIMVMTIPAQNAAPTLGTAEGSDVIYSYSNNKLILSFAGASAANPYEYCVVPQDGEFEVSKAKWKTVKSAKSVSLSEKSANGATIYVRFKGLNENVKKNIPLTLPSAYSSFVANGFTKK